MADYLEMIKDKELELSSLYKRMDEDTALCNLAKYVMMDSKNKPVPDVVNITLNKPALFAANVEAALNNATEQVSIETEDSKVDKDHIADCIRAGFVTANLRLRKQGKFPLNPFIDQQMCRRGRGAARCVFQIVDGVLKADITPWDARYVAYDTGEEDLSWASYRTKRNKADIVAEYPGVDVKSKLGEVVDFWNNEANVVYIDSKKVLEQPNPFGFPPVCVQTVTLGSMLADAGSLKHQGESIFFLMRDCVPELNRLLSIMQTRNMLAIKPPLGWASKDGLQEAPDYEDVASAASITPQETGGGATSVPFGDLQRYAIYALNVIDNAIKQGSLEIVDVGSLPGPLSAVALIEIGEGRDQIFLPRLAARGLLNEQIADMFIRQIIALGQSKVMLGSKGHEREFEVKKLEGIYEIAFKYFVKSPKIDIARYSIAQVAERYLDEESILKDVIQHEDPSGVIRRKHYDMAARLSPLVMTRRVIKSLTEMDNDDAMIDAELLAMGMGLELDKVLAGEISTITQPEEKPISGQAFLPLLPSGQSSSGKKASQLQGTPRESEGE